MGRRIVDRNAGIFRDCHHDQSEERQPQRNPQPHLRRKEKASHGRQLRRTSNQREREDDHDHRRLRQRGDHHLSTRADAAKARSDIETGQGQEETGAAEKRDDGDEIGGPRKQETGAECRHQRCRDPSGGKNEIGTYPEQPRGILRKHYLLTHEAHEVAVRLDHGRPAPQQQARLHRAREAREQRRQQQDQQHLRRLNGKIDNHGHIASTSNKSTSAAKTRLRNCRMVKNCR